MSDLPISVTIDSGQDGRYVQGSKLVRKGKLSVGIYTTGGAAITKGDLDLPVSLDHLDVSNANGMTFEWDKSAGKIKAYYGTGAHTHTENVAATYTQNATTGAVTAPTVGAEITNGADFSGVFARFIAYGT